ncbi:MAG: peptidoglycan DD-metalloendopeptidase family protein [Actinobacteria bacterium]|nr:peptidoglycan DD-metalloendopeptidase family protein [Actinomycetota bacterium]
MVVLRAVLAGVVVAYLSAAAPPAAGWSGQGLPPDRVSYVPPVDAPVVDPFRPPPNPYGPGNRGLTYGTSPGDAVRAAADGTVIFAGQVGGSLHVTILHADGLRTSYSFLATIAVRQNARVRQGDLVGTAGGTVHFGVRDPNDTYLDPALLFAGQLRIDVYLVAGPDDGDGRPGSRAREARALQVIVRDRLRAAAAFGRRVATDAADRWRIRARSAINLTTASHVASMARSMQGWYLQQSNCTAAATVPPRPAGRRIVVLVAGVGSSSDNAAITKVDTAALGYGSGDVIRYSYRGGTQPYTPADTEQDLTVSAERLNELLDTVAAANPGVPIDIVAHSQGGVVARMAVQVRTPPQEVQTLVTLGSPHGGANLATAVAAARLDPRSAEALRRARELSQLDLDPDGRSIAQLAETSTTIDALNRTSFPSSVRFTSIGARGDLTVPSPRTIVGDGSTSTVVPLSGLNAHDDLPGAAVTQREIALAVAGLPPTCRSFSQALADTITGESIDAVEDDLTATAAWAPVLSGSW